MRETKSEKGAKGFTCWGQFVAMHSKSVRGERGVIKEPPVLPKIEGDDSMARIAIDCDLKGEALQKTPIIRKDVIEFLMEIYLPVEGATRAP